jgi:hypothetical protein
MAKRITLVPHRHAPRIEPWEGSGWVETGVVCPGCNQVITADFVDHDGSLECGGPGEGICGPAHVAYALGAPNWRREVREQKEMFPENKLPSLQKCADIMDAFEEAGRIGEKHGAALRHKRNPRRR